MQLSFTFSWIPGHIGCTVVEIECPTDSQIESLHKLEIFNMEHLENCNNTKGYTMKGDRPIYILPNKACSLTRYWIIGQTNYVMGGGYESALHVHHEADCFCIIAQTMWATEHLLAVAMFRPASLVFDSIGRMGTRICSVLDIK